jgi:hypothetical protein
MFTLCADNLFRALLTENADSYGMYSCARSGYFLSKSVTSTCVRQGTSESAPQVSPAAFVPRQAPVPEGPLRPYWEPDARVMHAFPTCMRIIHDHQLPRSGQSRTEMAAIAYWNTFTL